MRAIYRNSFSLTNQVDIAITKSGNLIQLNPLNNEVSIFDEIMEEIIPVTKKRIAHLIQYILSHSHEDLIIDFIKNENPIIMMIRSVIELLNIIKKGIKVQDNIRIFSKLDFF